MSLNPEIAAQGTKHYTEVELADLSKSDLIKKILELQSQKRDVPKDENVNIKRNKRLKERRRFDFSTAHRRHILLKIMYFGWNYQGFAVQDNTANTIEDHLFDALIKTYLIEKRETSNYHRCGRTDKGVSSAGQVISITLRSRFPVEEQYKEENLNSELPYCKMLNHFLPNDIKVISWLPVPLDRFPYSARFDCNKRSYKYYFPKANYNLELMQEACNFLIGEHDFRNLCKLDINVKSYIRNIFSAQILPVEKDDTDKLTSFYYLYIVGSGFLWHQIRLIFSILLLVGQGKEEPTVIRDLLDILRYPTRPQFLMASGYPLNLYECNYDLEKEVNWIYDSHLRFTINHLHGLWLKHNTAAKMTEDCITNLEKIYQTDDRDSFMSALDLRIKGYSLELLAERHKPDKYVSILKRPFCKSRGEYDEVSKKKTQDNT